MSKKLEVDLKNMQVRLTDNAVAWNANNNLILNPDAPEFVPQNESKQISI